VAVELLTGSSSVSESFELDTTADGDETVLAVTVDTVINNSESDNVILTLTGVDSDAAIVTVTLTGADGGQVTANAEAGNNGDWIANVSGGTLADGYVAVSVNVTDDAGNTASTSTDFDLDTTADELDDLSVTVGDIIRESGTELVTLTLSGVDGDVDAATGVVVTLTDSDNNVVTASYDANSDNWVADLTGLYGHQVTVSSTVEDSAGNQSTVSTVAAINRAPEFASTEIDVSFDEGLGSDEIVYQASATDVNGDGLVYSLSGPDAQLMEIDDLTGMIRFRQSPDYESGKTVYEVTVVASDGDLSATQDVTVTVNDVNEAPDFDHDRVFLQQNENIDTTQVIWNASATDVDGDDVTYSLGGDDADAFDIDQNTGAVNFAQSPDYESGVTSYDFTITASDGSLTDEQAVTVQINNVVEQYTLDPADLASGGEFVGEAMDDRMDGRGATSALELSGGEGTDVLYGGDAGDVLDGGDGNDQLSGGGGDDVLIAGAGVDRIDGGDGIDTVVLGSGNEMVSINLAREWQYSGDGWNQIVNVENVVTGGGADIIKGNDIGNVVESGAGNDWVYANGGDDVLIGGEGIDRLFGGDGNDTVFYETDENLVIDLNSEWQLGNDGTSEGIDKLIDIENVTTGSGEDVLIGNDGANILTGGDGDDTLTGGDGADVFRFYSSEGPSTDVITDFTVGEDSIEFIDDTTGAVAQAQVTNDADGATVTWDDLTIMLDVNVNYDDINPITD
jgi:Ca2+-binding RTX toxin-like protein